MGEQDLAIELREFIKVILLESQTDRTPNGQRVEVSIQEGRLHVVIGNPIELAEYLVFLVEVETLELTSEVDFLRSTVVLEVGVLLNPENRIVRRIKEVGNSPIDFLHTKALCTWCQIETYIYIGLHEVQIVWTVKH